MSDQPATPAPGQPETAGPAGRSDAAGHMPIALADSQERRQFSLRAIWLATTLTALALVSAPFLSGWGRGMLAIYCLTFFFGCWKTRRGLLWVLPAMYAPYAWVFFLDTAPWRSYNVFWRGLFLQLPGLPVELIFHPMSDSWMQALTGIASLTMFFTVLLLARPSLRAAVLASSTLLLISCATSWLCYGFYRM